ERDHAQYGEDRIVLALLRALVCDRGGRSFQSICYVEIGGNHPIRNSNTWLLYKAGCRGVLVEPNPELAALLAHVRPRDTVISAAGCPRGPEAVVLQLG